MVGPLKYFDRDPEGKGRGPGLYYHRGKGRWSKYSAWRDRKHSETKRQRKRKKKQDYVKGLVGKGPYRHTHDKSYDAPGTKKKRKRKKKR